MDRTGRSRKRHTKPCKYFQRGTCPLTARECDFVHVQPFSVPTYVADPRVFQNPHRLPDPQMDPYTPKSHFMSPTAPYPVQISYANPHPPAGVYSPYSPDVLPSPIIPLPGTYHPTAIVRLPSEPYSLESPITSSDDAGSSADEIPFSDAPNSPNSIGAHNPQQQQLRQQPMVQPSTPPPYSASAATIRPPPPPPSSRVQAVPGQLKSRSRSLGPSKKKIAKYKTKVCRFWTPEHGCPNGIECTFLHGDETKSMLPEPKHNLPAKPVSEQEVNAQRGFFPINWRVIGGGVKMGVGTEAEQVMEIQKDLRDLEIGDRPSPDEGRAPRRRVRSTSMSSTPIYGETPWHPIFSAET